MIVRCLGSWAEGFTHAPANLGVKAPLEDQRPSDGCCDRCCKAMGVPIPCKWCDKAETLTGICTSCVKELGARAGKPFLELTVYRADADPISGTYDGSGAMLHLGNAMRHPNYCAFKLRALTVAEVA